MIGNHAIPVIVDAYLKGFKGFDAEEAYQAVKASATVSHFNSDWETFEKYGYFPFDIIDTESVSKTLECAYDDYCVAQMAKALGKTEDYERFSKRAAFYKNLFDPELKANERKRFQRQLAYAVQFLPALTRQFFGRRFHGRQFLAVHLACTARCTRPDRPDGWQRGFRDQTRLIVLPRKHG